MSRKIFPFWILISLVFLPLAACAQAPAASSGETAYPPSVLMTALPYPPEGALAYPSPGAGGVLLGPMPFPTPQAEATAWEKLIDRQAIADVQWQEYSGQIQGKEAGQGSTIVFQYPSIWAALTDSDQIHISVQANPSAEGEIKEDYVRFEISRLDAPPSISQGQILDPEELQTVVISGLPAVMQISTDLPGMGRNITAFTERDGAWYAFSGMIALPEADYDRLERYTDVLLFMISSVEFQ